MMWTIVAVSVAVVAGFACGWFVRRELDHAELNQRNREIARAKAYLGYRPDRTDSISAIVMRHCDPGEVHREQAS